jgi:hypothetical protein
MRISSLESAWFRDQLTKPGLDGVCSSRPNVLTKVFWDDEELRTAARSLAEGREVKKLVHRAFPECAVTKLDSPDWSNELDSEAEKHMIKQSTRLVDTPLKKFYDHINGAFWLIPDLEGSRRRPRRVAAKTFNAPAGEESMPWPSAAVTHGKVQRREI